MSFTFGQSSFGAKPTGFSTPFGTTTTTTTASGGFTGFGASTFGTPAATTAPAFGSTFGTAPTAGVASGTAPVFGSTFGAVPPSSTPAFGTTFGTPATTAPAFGSTFGTATSAAPPTFGTSFGAPAVSSTATPGIFGTTGVASTKPSLFGTPGPTSLFSTTTATPNLFGSGITTTQGTTNLFGASTTPSLFGSTTSAPSLFGTGTGGIGGGSTTFGTATSAPSGGGGLFGTVPGFGSSTIGSNLFGTTTTTSAPSLFGGGAFATGSQGPTGGFGGFGTTSSSFGTGIGTTTTTPSLFGFNVAAQKPAFTAPVPPPTQDTKLQQTLASFYAINIFGDERDDILKKWNMLQACWGTGKGYYSAAHPPVEYDHTNPFFRFKAIGYVVIPQPDNADGLVKLHFNKKESEISNQKEALVNAICTILGSKPNLTVNIEHVRAISDTESEVMLTVSEKGVTGTSRKIHASDLSNFFHNVVQKQQLCSLGVTFIGAYMTPTKTQLEEYLKVPPPGTDLQMWQAAQIDNPQPQKYMPTPISGFTDLKKRMMCQEYETGLHAAFIDKVNNDITELKKKQASALALIAERKQKFLELQHRLLKILIKQEVIRKVGMAFQPEEEIIRGRLETLHSQLSVPTQFRGRLLEVMSVMSIMNSSDAPSSTGEQYRIEPVVQDDIRQFLQMEQTGIQHLITIINNDLKDLKLIQDGLAQIVSGTN